MERRRYRPCLGGGCLPAGTCRKPPCLGLVELPPVPYSSRVLHSLTPPLLAAPPQRVSAETPAFYLFLSVLIFQGKPNAGQEQPAADAETPLREPEHREEGDTQHQNEVEEEEEDEEEEDEDEDEQQLLGEFERELDGILLPSDRARLRTEVKAGMERELENIVREVRSSPPPVASEGCLLLWGQERTEGYMGLGQGTLKWQLLTELEGGWWGRGSEGELRGNCSSPVEHEPLAFTAYALDSPLPPWAFQTEKELDPDGLKKESERDRAMLALTSTLNKLIKKLEEKQSPELLKKHRKRRVVPQKPPPPPQPAGESCQTQGSGQVPCLSPQLVYPKGTMIFPSRGAPCPPSLECFSLAVIPLPSHLLFILLGSSF